MGAHALGGKRALRLLGGRRRLRALQAGLGPCSTAGPARCSACGGRRDAALLRGGEGKLLGLIGKVLHVADGGRVFRRDPGGPGAE